MYFACPLCGNALDKKDNTLICSNNHCYDISKHGYVNLLLSQKSSKKRHGDDKLMLKSRQDFLEKGFYKPLLNLLTAEVLKKSNGKALVILDSGCGEGYYTANIQKALPHSQIYGIDISKEALIFAAKRDKTLKLAAASSSDIPIKNGCCDIILNIFSPTATIEFSKKLKPDGILIKAYPLENHLFGLKAAVYEKPYKNKSENLSLDGFVLTDVHELRYTLELTSNEDIMNLFKMTPYYYKTSRADQEKLLALSNLKTEIEFGIAVYELNDPITKNN